MKDDFIKKTNEQANTQNSSYDYESLTQYQSNVFSKNGWPVIEALQPNVKLGQRYYLSKTDIEGIRLFYNCKTTGFTLPPTITIVTTTTSKNIYKTNTNFYKTLFSEK